MRKLKREVGWILFGVVFTALLAASFLFDPQISRLFSSARSGLLNQFFLGIKFLDNEIAVVAFLTAIFLLNRKKREWILPLWATVFLAGAASFVLKYSIRRQRPFAQNIVALLPGIADKIGYHVWDFSFPSFDTALAFCAVPLVWKFFPRFRYVWIAFAILVGFSRIYFGLHFLSDVLVGAMAGLAAGMLALKLEEKNGKLRLFSRKVFGA